MTAQREDVTVYIEGRDGSQFIVVALGDGPRMEMTRSEAGGLASLLLEAIRATDSSTTDAQEDKDG